MTPYYQSVQHYNQLCVTLVYFRVWEEAVCISLIHSIPEADLVDIYAGAAYTRIRHVEIRL